MLRMEIVTCRLGTQPKGIGDGWGRGGGLDVFARCRLGTQPKGIGDLRAGTHVERQRERAA